MRQFPVFLICRDQITWLKPTVEWLEGAGQEEIYLIDNDSTYPPLLEYYEGSPHTVIQLGENIGNDGPWSKDVLAPHTKGRYFIVSDPDIVPVEDCPPDVFDYFFQCLQRYSSVKKVGFSLKIDDLPDHYEMKELVLQRHKQFWHVSKRFKSDRSFFNVGLDTTMALYRPEETKHHRVNGALRSDKPYEARHLPWYMDSTNPPEDVLYYREHTLPNMSNWAMPELPSRIVNAIGRESRNAK